MTELLTAAQMRAIETAAIESGEVTGLELMERAGAGVVEAIFEEWPELAQGGAAPHPAKPDSPRDISSQKKHRAVVLCGPGNNGGDGFVVARLLQERGWEVEVFLYGDAEKLPPDARTNYERWCGLGEVAALSEIEDVTSNAPDLVLDALFGTGLTRPVEGLRDVLLDVSEATARGFFFDVANCRVTSIDLPSGICSDSGAIIKEENSSTDLFALAGGNISSQLTVSFHGLKLGHVLKDGPLACGKVVVKSIGLEMLASSVAKQRALFGEIVGLASPASVRKSDTFHKFSHGHALILSGGAGKTGAARLAARGALRVGAGLVTLGVPHEAQAEVAAQITALMMREVGDAGALAKTLEDDRLNALCLGPGMGFERARELVPVALKGGVQTRLTRSVVLDADALSAYAENPESLFEMLHETCVLTPHAGEFKRLFPDIAEKLDALPTKGPAYSKVDATREAAARAGCLVLLKGPDTVIADPKGHCSVNAAVYDRSAPWLATAGSGDVLAGFITGLLARGLAPMQAAETGAWLHVACARKFGPGLISEDLPEQLPAVFRDLGL